MASWRPFWRPAGQQASQQARLSRLLEFFRLTWPPCNTSLPVTRMASRRLLLIRIWQLLTSGRPGTLWGATRTRNLDDLTASPRKVDYAAREHEKSRRCCHLARSPRKLELECLTMSFLNDSTLSSRKLGLECLTMSFFD